MKRTGVYRTKLILSVFCFLILYLLLLIPTSAPPPLPPGDASPFVWNQDDYWSHLETMFVNAGNLDSAILSDSIRSRLAKAEYLLDSCRRAEVEPSSVLLSRLETAFFELTPLIAAQTGYLPEFIEFRNRLRTIIKVQSLHWDMTSAITRDRLYRLLFGTRTAIEEVVLQAEIGIIPAMVIAADEPSATPSAEILGVKIHSGDILVSRGGAPTSALIARGSDYPGNFSHVALIHVDENSHKISIVESHIECGAIVTSVEEYLRDTKLRILVLRLRADHPMITADPMLPHTAATIALKRTQQEHIPYDFEMDFKDNSKLFCSEVASDPYSQLNIKLWMGISKISSVGVRSWLAAFGVKYFETQEPSDLEYDPQLKLIAEWHDPEKLYKDHLDNAVIDVMLEGAESGERLKYDWYMLPFGRLLKVYSIVKNLWGGVGPIPEGMSAEAALKNDRFSKRHTAIKKSLIQLAEEFKQNHGYRPPYWELVRLARLAKENCG